MTTQENSTAEISETEINDEEAQSILREFVDHQKKAIEEARLALEGLIPITFKEHGKSAVQEVVEGYRTLFTSMIDGVNEKIQKLRGSAG